MGAFEIDRQRIAVAFRRPISWRREREWVAATQPDVRSVRARFEHNRLDRGTSTVGASTQVGVCRLATQLRSGSIAGAIFVLPGKADRWLLSSLRQLVQSFLRREVLRPRWWGGITGFIGCEGFPAHFDEGHSRCQWWENSSMFSGNGEGPTLSSVASLSNRVLLPGLPSSAITPG